MSEKALSYAIPLSFELAGIFILVIGVAVEVVTQADLGYQLISIGSTLIAAGSIIWGKIFKLKESKEGNKSGRGRDKDR